MERADCAAIVVSIARLGPNLGLVTTAERVETETQFDLVRGAGVKLAQGYLLGRPVRAYDLHFDAAVNRASASAAA